MEPDITTVTLTRGKHTVSINGVPANICERCHEYYLPEEVAAKVLAMADKVVSGFTKAERASIDYSSYC
jgi:YgiT-type zinc finger domain-containing protein